VSSRQTYLARVRGRFPAHLAQGKLAELPAAELVWDHSEIKNNAWGKGGATADGKKRRREEGGEEGGEEAAAAAATDTDTAGAAAAATATAEGEGVGGGGGGVDYSELSDEVYRHPEVGYGYHPDGSFTLRSAIGVVSSRDGVHSNNPAGGKPAFTRFRLLAYSAADDTSLVECMPLTGRTHQIRLHLQLLGNPIANDPCYGGKLMPF
jgi:hypothetical protein